MNRKDVANILYTIKDPEIPTLSIVDLGIVTDIQVQKNRVDVVLTPTFSGCPALKVMEEMVEEKLLKQDEIDQVNVNTRFDHQWTSDMISEQGKKRHQKNRIGAAKKILRWSNLGFYRRG